MEPTTRSGRVRRDLICICLEWQWLGWLEAGVGGAIAPARREAEERARREAEEQAKREAEEQARCDAEEQARRVRLRRSCSTLLRRSSLLRVAVLAGGRRWCNGSGSHTRASQPHAYDTYSPCMFSTLI